MNIKAKGLPIKKKEQSKGMNKHLKSRFINALILITTFLMITQVFTPVCGLFDDDTCVIQNGEGGIKFCFELSGSTSCEDMLDEFDSGGEFAEYDSGITGGYLIDKETSDSCKDLGYKYECKKGSIEYFRTYSGEHCNDEPVSEKKSK